MIPEKTQYNEEAFFPLAYLPKSVQKSNRIPIEKRRVYIVFAQIIVIAIARSQHSRKRSQLAITGDSYYTLRNQRCRYIRTPTAHHNNTVTMANNREPFKTPAQDAKKFW